MKFFIPDNLPEELRVFLRDQETYYYHYMRAGDYRNAYCLTGYLCRYFQAYFPNEWQLMLEARMAALDSLLIGGANVDPDYFSIKILIMVHNLYQEYVLSNRYYDLPQADKISMLWANMVQDFRAGNCVEQQLDALSKNSSLPCGFRKQIEKALKAVQSEIELEQKIRTPKSEFMPSTDIDFATLFSKFSILAAPYQESSQSEECAAQAQTTKAQSPYETTRCRSPHRNR
ncbi:MAG: hypothetical protein K0S08_2083 [Gammaproteobacteria bacterium]|jgi:hypothetical protein|nr:hypothetical protein [Gammaproteobacteria bacterium]